MFHRFLEGIVPFAVVGVRADYVSFSVHVKALKQLKDPELDQFFQIELSQTGRKAVRSGPESSVNSSMTQYMTMNVSCMSKL